MSQISTNTEVTATEFQHITMAGLLNRFLERKYVADFSPTPPLYSERTEISQHCVTDTFAKHRICHTQRRCKHDWQCSCLMSPRALEECRLKRNRDVQHD